MEEQIKTGDVVQFKGGGSPMTVEKIEGGEAICVFSLGGKQRLKLALLEKISSGLTFGPSSMDTCLSYRLWAEKSCGRLFENVQ